MQDIEPYYNWRDEYCAEEDEKSPFFEREYSEFYYTNKIYNFYIHPQWDEFGSQTLYLKLLFAHYEEGFAIIEFIGEWNDCIYNDIMTLKRNIIDTMLGNKITKFICIGENVLNFHPSDDCYYEEWNEDVNEQDGWIVFVNFRDHVIEQFQESGIDYYVQLGDQYNDIDFRTLSPMHFYGTIERKMMNRISY